MANTKTETTTVSAPTFSKEQILKSNKYNKRRDLLSVLLEDNKTYTISEVDNLIEKYMKGGKR